MRQLLILAIPLSGCILADDGINDGRGGKHTLTINWAIRQPGGNSAPCPPGFNNLVMSSTTKEREGQVQEHVPCATAGTHQVELYTSGERTFKMEDDPAIYVERFTENYEHIIYVTDPTGTIKRAESLPFYMKLDRDMTIDVDLYPDGGHYLQSWQLWSGITGSRAYSCEAVGLDEIELRYRVFTFDGEPEAPSTSVRWPCTESHDEHYYKSEEAVGQGFAPALAPEDYLGTLIGYRGGVEVVRNDEINFNIMTGGLLTEAEDDLRVQDR